MEERELKWEVREKKTLLSTRVFDVLAQEEKREDGQSGEFYAVSAPDWVVIVPVYQGCFVMVRQFRHAEEVITTELPGGVIDRGETPEKTASRELLEETGFRAGKLTYLGTCSPNPALFKNHFYAYLAEDLTPTGIQHLDSDEFLNYQLIPVEEVIRDFGSGEYTHAFTGTAIMMYLRHIGCVPKAGQKKD